MKVPIKLVLLPIWLLLVVPQNGLAAGGKAITEHANFSNLKRALTRFVEVRGGHGRATLVIPKYRDQNQEVVIFWVEKRALFLFPLNFQPEVVKHPSLVIRRFWKLTSDYFYPSHTKNPGYRSSTYMNTWGWAKEKVFNALKDGYILTIGPATEHSLPRNEASEGSRKHARDSEAH